MKPHTKPFIHVYMKMASLFGMKMTQYVSCISTCMVCIKTCFKKEVIANSEMAFSREGRLLLENRRAKCKIKHN